MQTTLNRIGSLAPCEDGWKKLLKHLGKTEPDDEPLPLLTVLESNGARDAIFCLRAVEDPDRETRLFAVHCARRAHSLTNNIKSLYMLDVVESYAAGQATRSQLSQAWVRFNVGVGVSDWTAAQASDWVQHWEAAQKVSSDAAKAVAMAASLAAASGATLAATWHASWATASVSSKAAAYAAAWYAIGNGHRDLDALYEAECQKQGEELRRILQLNRNQP